MSTLTLLLRLVHVLSGTFWVGSALFFTFLLGPSLKRLGPSGGPVLAELMRRRYHDALLYSALAAILSGGWLMWIVSGHLRGAWLMSGFGVTMLVGSAASLAALVVALAWIRPTTLRLTVLEERIRGAGRTPALEEQEVITMYRATLSRWGARSAVLLLVAAGAMGVGRYL